MPAASYVPAAQTLITQSGSGEYQDYRQNQQYQHRTGLVVVPRAADGALPKLVRVHCDYGMRQVDWTSSRVNRPPVVPAQENTRSDLYLGATVTTALPVPDTDSGGYRWTVSGCYVFLQGVRARRVGIDPLPTGAYPYTIQPQDSAAYELLKTASPASGGINPVDDVVTGVGNQVVNHDQLYPWPFTVLPPQVGSGGLVGG